jgi:hypothetical protein
MKRISHHGTPVFLAMQGSLGVRRLLRLAVTGTLGTVVAMAGVVVLAGPAAAASKEAAAPRAVLASCSGQGSANATFVCAVYEDLLGRAPDPSGEAGWLAALSSGSSPTQVAYGVLASTEYRSAFINADYKAFLNRNVDTNGLNAWLADFSSGGTDEQIDSGILGSPEFFSDSGSTNSGFVSAVYEGLLGRAADAPGLAAWSADLANGTSRSAVAYDIDISNESRTNSVTFFYQYFLNRAADSSGLSTWVSALNSGATDEQVIAGIVGSPEFYSDVTGS